MLAIMDLWERSFLGVARCARMRSRGSPHFRLAGRHVPLDPITGKPNGGTPIRTILEDEIQNLGRRGKLRGLRPRRFSAAHASLVENYIHANLDRELNLFDLASVVRLSRRQFFRMFSNTYWTTPHRYVMNERVARAKELMLRGKRLAEIAAALGFANRRHFSCLFREATGMSPTRFLQEHRSRRERAQ